MVTGMVWGPILAVPCQVPTSFFMVSSSFGTGLAGMAWSGPASAPAARMVQSERAVTSERVNMGSSRCRWVASAAGAAGKGVQQEAPAPGVVDGLAEGGGVVAVALEVAVLEGDPGALRPLGDEGDLDLGDEAGIVLPLGGDLPGQHQTAGRLPDQHLADVALRAVLAHRVPATARPCLQHGPGHGRLADVVLARPPAI